MNANDGSVEYFGRQSEFQVNTLKKLLNEYCYAGLEDGTTAQRKAFQSILFGEEEPVLFVDTLVASSEPVQFVEMEPSSASGASGMPAMGGGDEIEIVVKTLTGKNIEVKITQLSTIECLKYLIQGTEGIPIDQQRLVFAGRQLEDGFTLADYKIENEILYIG